MRNDAKVIRKEYDRNIKKNPDRKKDVDMVRAKNTATALEENAKVIASRIDAVKVDEQHPEDLSIGLAALGQWLNPDMQKFDKRTNGQNCCNFFTDYILDQSGKKAPHRMILKHPNYPFASEWGSTRHPISASAWYGVSEDKVGQSSNGRGPLVGQNIGGILQGRAPRMGEVIAYKGAHGGGHVAIS